MITRFLFIINDAGFFLYGHINLPDTAED